MKVLGPQYMGHTFQKSRFWVPLVNIFFVGHPVGLFCLVDPRSTETLAEEGAMLSVVDWLLGWRNLSKGVDVSGK